MSGVDGPAEQWRSWGPYLAERAWGTAREEDAADGQTRFSYEQARSRAYRWGEDGMAGVCDEQQTFCFAFAFWNGADPFLKERVFGLTDEEGNHGADAKDYWWYLDATPTSSWLRWRYHYPQRPFPYDRLRAGNTTRGCDQPEYELAETGVFDEDRYWSVTVDYAKAGPEDYCVRLTVENRGPEEATLHALPTLWFRNRWDHPAAADPDAWGEQEQVPPVRPTIRGQGSRLFAEHPEYGRLVLIGSGNSEPLLCDNETNTRLLNRAVGWSEFPKDGINDHVVTGQDTINPLRIGTKGALRYKLTVPAGGRTQVRLRLARGDSPWPPGLGSSWDQVMADRQREADLFYAGLPTTSPDDARILRQAAAGLLWSRQRYEYLPDREEPGTEPAEPAEPVTVPAGDWRHLHAADLLTVPDGWERPGLAGWDLAFQCLPMAHLDPEFAKRQLLLLCAERYQHPSGQLPGSEDDLGGLAAANPPVHAWAALRVFEIDGCGDRLFLARMLHKLVGNFSWWLDRWSANREAGATGTLERRLDRPDSTAWLAMYALNLLEMSLWLAVSDPAYADLTLKFLDHYARLTEALAEEGLWDEQDGLFQAETAGQETRPDGTPPLTVRSLTALIPLFAVVSLADHRVARVPGLAERLQRFEEAWSARRQGLRLPRSASGRHRLLGVVGPDQLDPLLARLLDGDEFLSRYGLRSRSAHQRGRSYSSPGDWSASVAYEPGEPRTRGAGAEPNWRGPIWFPLNHLVIHALDRYGQFLGDSYRVEFPLDSGQKATLSQVAAGLRGRLVDLFRADPAGRRPVLGGADAFWRERGWGELIPFHEYFHGDTGAGLGSTHQTGTALALCLLMGD